MFNGELRAIHDRRAYIYTISPEPAQHNCSGTVTAVEFCYRVRAMDEVRSGETKEVFYFLSLTQDSSNQRRFTVNRRISINSTASNSICAEVGPRNRVCCENKRLEYQVPSSTFTFGIVARKDFRLLISTNTTTEYIEQRYFSESVINTATQEGSSFQTYMYKPINMSLLLLRFHIRYIAYVNYTDELPN